MDYEFHDLATIRVSALVKSPLVDKVPAMDKGQQWMKIQQ
jgi:hypothetical protein